LGYIAASPIEKRKHVPNTSIAPIDQQVEWMPKPPDYNKDENYSIGEKTGNRVEPNYDMFCDKTKVAELFAAKSVFDNIERKKFIAARYSSNPYETIGKHIFMNRAAMKMANLDHHFSFTSPKRNISGRRFCFADICAGPGGFSQYILWKLNSKADGWGFTLKGDDDFKLSDFKHVNTKTFHTEYGVDKTGDITNNDNIRHFTKIIDQNTNDVGLDLVTADGGFSVDGEENYQEELLKQLILCQFLTALSILRRNGNFVCKIFDAFTPFTVGLIYILYRHFDHVCIIKPHTSRPANSERYVVCKYLHSRKPPVINYLFDINDKLNKSKPADKAVLPTTDILEIVDPSMFSNEFVQYIKKI